jgi:hypothetical protein
MPVTPAVPIVPGSMPGLVTILVDPDDPQPAPVPAPVPVPATLVAPNPVTAPDPQPAPVPAPVPVPATLVAPNPVTAPDPISVEVDNQNITFVNAFDTNYVDVRYSGTLLEDVPSGDGLLTMSLFKYKNMDHGGDYYVTLPKLAYDMVGYDEPGATIVFDGQFERGVFKGGNVSFKAPKKELDSDLDLFQKCEVEMRTDRNVTKVEWEFLFITNEKVYLSIAIRMSGNISISTGNNLVTTSGPVMLEVFFSTDGDAPTKSIEYDESSLAVMGTVSYAGGTPTGATSFVVKGEMLNKVWDKISDPETRVYMLLVTSTIPAFATTFGTPQSDKFTWENISDKRLLFSYEGGFDREGKLSGMSKRTVSNSVNTVTYEGQYKYGYAEDTNATISFPNGWKYRGGVVGNLQHGYGTLVSPSNDKWEGQWNEGERTSFMGQFIGSDGRVLSGWWEEGRNFVDTTSYARSEANQRASLASHSALFNKFRPPYDKIPSIVVQKPNYDIILAAQGEIVLRRASSLTTTTIKKLFASTNPAKLGVGRDVLNYIGGGNRNRYYQLKPIRVYDVDYSKNNLNREWERSQADHFTRMAYCVTGKNPATGRGRDYSKGEIKPPPDSKSATNDTNPLFVRTRVDRLPGLSSEGSPLEGDINEKFLVHGTTSANILPMLLSGPTNKFSSGGVFGKAVYFAEDVGKSDQYCKVTGSSDLDYGPNGALKQMLGIKPEEYEDAAVSARGEKDVFYMFVVRVSLGCPAVLEASDYHANRAGKPDTEANKERLFFEPTDMLTSAQVSANNGRGIAGMGSAYKLDNRFQSVVIDDWGPHASLNMRFREFMVYSGFVAKITHIVAYKRILQWPDDVPRKDKYGAFWQPHPSNFDRDPTLIYDDPLDYKGTEGGKPKWKVPVVDPADFAVEKDEDTASSVLEEMNMTEDNSIFPVDPPAPPPPPAAAAAAAAAASSSFTPAPVPTPGGASYPGYPSFTSKAVGNASEVKWQIFLKTTPYAVGEEVYSATYKKSKSFGALGHLPLPPGSEKEALMKKVTEIVRTPGSTFTYDKGTEFIFSIGKFLELPKFPWKEAMDGLATWVGGKTPGKVGSVIDYKDKSLVYVTITVLEAYSRYFDVKYKPEITFDAIHTCICRAVGVGKGYSPQHIGLIPNRVEKKWKEVSINLFEMRRMFRSRGLTLNGNTTAAEIDAVNP